MYRSSRSIAAITVITALLLAASTLPAAGSMLTGKVTDPQGRPVAGAKVIVVADRDAKPQEVSTDQSGAFTFPAISPGVYKITASSPEFFDVSRNLNIADSSVPTVNLQFERLASRSDSVTVTSDVKDLDIQNPDPAQRVLVRDEILDANPGRPGAPVSIPGLPIETASGGIKAPQYFAPGVAGDHGEPIAQFVQVGSFLLPNNLNANAHDNGYADPNIMVPAIIESVQTDGGAFNVREGDHSVDLAATYTLRPSLEPFATLTADYRDVDVSGGWKWLAIQASLGNGFLDTMEHRQQYKINGLKGWDLGAHRLTALVIGYYGQSKIPGLVPIDVPNLHDTIDPRQRDQTHTGEMALNDVWHLAPASDLQLSGFFRTYNLSLYSNFGDGLIRQSEFRTVTGANATYIRKFNRHFTLMAGLDYLRDAPPPRRSGSLLVHQSFRLWVLRESDSERHHSQFRDAIFRHRWQHPALAPLQLRLAARPDRIRQHRFAQFREFVPPMAGDQLTESHAGNYSSRKFATSAHGFLQLRPDFFHERPQNRYRKPAGQPDQPGPRVSNRDRQNHPRH